MLQVIGVGAVFLLFMNIKNRQPSTFSQETRKAIKDSSFTGIPDQTNIQMKVVHDPFGDQTYSQTVNKNLANSRRVVGYVNNNINPPYSNSSPFAIKNPLPNSNYRNNFKPTMSYPGTHGPGSNSYTETPYKVPGSSIITGFSTKVPPSFYGYGAISYQPFKSFLSPFEEVPKRMNIYGLADSQNNSFMRN